jgi:hydrogenase maturation protease
VFRPVAALRVGDRRFHTWQEAEERAIDLGDIALSEILDRPRQRSFTIPGRHWSEPLHAAGGEVSGVLVREQQSLTGSVEVMAARVAEGLYRLTLVVQNRAALADGKSTDRDAVLLRTLISTHSILGVRRGEFVSLLEPPEEWGAAAAACRNVGTWPVLVGAEGQRDTMLSSPIILYDYPQVAPESPGDCFDGTEMDEMLTLRILTLTDEEKRDMAAVDEHARALLARTEGLGGDETLRLHGTFRELRPSAGSGHG